MIKIKNKRLIVIMRLTFIVSIINIPNGLANGSFTTVFETSYTDTWELLSNEDMTYKFQLDDFHNGKNMKIDFSITNNGSDIALWIINETGFQQYLVNYNENEIDFNNMNSLYNLDGQTYLHGNLLLYNNNSNMMGLFGNSTCNFLILNRESFSTSYTIEFSVEVLEESTSPEEAIPGYGLLSIILIVGVISAILIKKRLK